MIRVWADALVRERLGEQLYLLNPTVEGHLDFFDFDLAGLPTRVVGSITVEGDVRAKFNSSVTRLDMDDGVLTGPPGTEPAPTDVSVTGNTLIFGQTTSTDGTLEFDEPFEFGITGVGTTQMMTIRVEAELEFDNSDGSIDIGVVVAHVRLRVSQS